MTLGILAAVGKIPSSPMDLGADPVDRLLHACGITALNMLLITLLVTPARMLTGWSHLLRLRRMLGLFAAFYALAHFVVYAWLDQGLDLAAVGADIIKRPYITIGMLALLLLVPLAITSTNRMMRRLGRRWQKLHMLVYLVALLGVWHYWWQVKKDIREPLLYFAIFGVLMAFRAYRAFRAKSAPATAPGRT
ncbi:MAG: sulfoxide reductase heme-binding subunit YedZ [Gammaproteobacteria bacterium]|nr:sulfoxide reductase heme-binding subunit YedZ [Gammaproteobacteria bacterium]